MYKLGGRGLKTHEHVSGPSWRMCRCQLRFWIRHEPIMEDFGAMDATRLYLDVPYAHRDRAKQAGAWWDPTRRRWYVPTGRPVDYPELEEWVPIEPCPPGAGVVVAILGMSVECHRCAATTMAVVGLDPGRGDGFATTTCCFNLTIVARLFGQSLPQSVGELKERRSRTVRASYMSNGCRCCDVLLGGFPLGEELSAAVADDRRGIVVLAHGEIHPLLLEAALAHAWCGG